MIQGQKNKKALKIKAFRGYIFFIALFWLRIPTTLPPHRFHSRRASVGRLPPSAPWKAASRGAKRILNPFCLLASYSPDNPPQAPEVEPSCRWRYDSNPTRRKAASKKRKQPDWVASFFVLYRLNRCHGEKVNEIKGFYDLAAFSSVDKIDALK